VKLITERPIFIMIHYLYLFLLNNLCFLLSNGLFFFVYLTMDLKFDYIGLLFISLIPMGPAFGAVFYTMGKLVREKEISPIQDYLKGYKQNFKISLGYWSGQLLLLFILVVNIRYISVSGEMSSFLLFFMIFFLFVLVLNLYAFPILTRFEMKLKNLYLVSAFYLFKYWKLTLFNLTTVISFSLIYYQFPLLSFLFSSSLTPYFLMFNMKKLVEKIEEAVTVSSEI